MNAAHDVRLRSNHRPLYAQASEALRDLLQSGGYAPGERLPSEHALSGQLGISRPTLREALRLLEEEGAIVRRHGVGTFAAHRPPTIAAGLEALESLEQLAERTGLHTTMGDASIEERQSSTRESKGLGLAAAVPVTAIKRVMLAGGLRVAHLIDIVPQAYLRRSDLSAGFTGSVLDHLLARAGSALSHSRTELCAEAADSEIARALHVTRGAPLMRLEAQLFAKDGQVVDYSISHFVPGYFRFHVVRRIPGM